MKKALSLLLALVMCLSLCACGNTQTMEEKQPSGESTPDFVEELTFGVWKKTLMSKATLVFNENGSGTMTFINGSSNSFDWRMNDSTISIITEHNQEYTYTVDVSKEYTRIIADDGLAYVKEANYDIERAEETKRLSAEAIEIDWETIYNEYSDNEVSAKEKYKGKPIKFTASPANISSNRFDIFRKTSKATGFMTVYMDSDYIATLDGDKGYTFVGFLNGGYTFLSVAGAFVAE